MLLFCPKSPIHLKLNSIIFANSAKSEPNSDIEDQKFVILFGFSFPRSMEYGNIGYFYILAKCFCG